MSLNIYFDAAKKKLDIERDAVLARKLGIIPQHLNRARKQGWCTDEVLEQISQILSVPLEELVLAREASKPHHEVIHAVWQRCYDKYAQAAGSVYYRKLDERVSLLPELAYSAARFFLDFFGLSSARAVSSFFA